METTTTNEATSGSKYDRTLDITEIAKRLRAEVKAAVKAGSLPEMKFSIRIQRYSGGQSLRLEVQECRSLVGKLLNESIASVKRGYLDFDFWGPVEFDANGNAMPRGKFAKEAQAVIDTLAAMVAAYNYDRSDIQVDYFDVNFYAHVEFSGAFVNVEALELFHKLQARK